MPALGDEEEIQVEIWKFRIGIWMRDQAWIQI